MTDIKPDRYLCFVHIATSKNGNPVYEKIGEQPASDTAEWLLENAGGGFSAHIDNITEVGPPVLTGKTEGE